LTGVSLEEVMQANCLESSDLMAGQIIHLPPRPTPTPCGPPPAGWTSYTVQADDTLSGLALAAGISQESIVQANCLETADLVVGQTLYLPPLATPTPTPCVPSPPAGWTLYTVRPGDTLFALAAVRDTSADEVVRVNCLDTSSILAGQRLYLPPLSVAYQAPTRVPTQPGGGPNPTPVPAQPTSVFDPAPGSGTMPPMVWDSPAPNYPGYTPCESQGGGATAPWISTPTEVRPGNDRHDLELGWRSYYFACAFRSPDTLTATMTDPKGAKTVLRVLELEELLIPGLNTGTALRAVIWNARCHLDIGPYVLTLDDGNDAVEHRFNVRESDYQEILAIPRAGTPGTRFEIYYCGYKGSAGEEVQIDLYYEAGQRPDGRLDFEHAAEWTVAINDDGWAWEEITSLPTDPARIYRIRDRVAALKGTDTIWLVQPQ
jgi:LysM repeat protein